MSATARGATRRDPVELACRLHEAAVAQQARGRADRAEAACRRSLRLLEQALGPDHPDLANVLNTLAGILQGRTAYDEAEAACRRSVAIVEAIPRGAGPDVERIRVQSLDHLATLWRMQGR